LWVNWGERWDTQKWNKSKQKFPRIDVTERE
jgi:hypothetical protein